MSSAFQLLKDTHTLAFTYRKTSVKYFDLMVTQSNGHFH